MKRYIILFLLLHLVIITFSQKRHIKFEHISLEQGLSQSTVKSIVQDCKGFMWFATIDGLNKYDGYKIKIYEVHTSVKGSISDNVLNVLHESTDGYTYNLWIGTAGNGLCKYDRVKDNFITYRNEPGNPNSLSNNSITSITSYKNNLWIGTNDGLNKFDIANNTFSVIKSSKENKAGLIDNYIVYLTIDKTDNLWIASKGGLNRLNLRNLEISVVEKNKQFSFKAINTLMADHNNILWIGTDEGLYCHDFKANTFKHFNNRKNDLNSLSNNNVISIVEDYENILWIGTENGGLNRFDQTNNVFQGYKNDPSDPNSLSIDNVITIYQDKSRILWIGTSLGGINKWNRAAEALQVFRHNPYDVNSLNSNQIRNIYQDKNGNTWIGTIDGGLNRWDTAKNIFIHYKHDSNNPFSISHNHARSILQDSHDNFWVGTDGGGLNKLDLPSQRFQSFMHDDNNPKSLSDNHIWKVLEDRKGQIWVATYGGGLNKFDSKSQTFTAFRNNPNDKSSISSDFITSLCEDHKGILWIGTFGGLNQLSDNQSFKSFKYDESNPKSLSNNRIYCIIEDPEGEIWIGTKGGLNKYDRKTETFIRYTSENCDLPNNVVMGIIDDDHGNLWVSTNRGISKLNKKTVKVRTFDVRDGLQSNEFLAGSFFKSKKGELFFGGINGFNTFIPGRIKDNPNIPSLAITGFRVSNNEIELDSSVIEKNVIVLNHNQRDLTFNFVALDFIFPEKNQYAYQLTGYDKDWQYVKFSREAKYTNLNPGTYVFKVKGSNNDEVWNEKGTSIRIIIEPAFWQTTWFRVAVPVLVVLFISFYIFNRFRTIKRRNEQLENLVYQRTAEILKQKDQIQQKNEELNLLNEDLHQKNEEITAQRDEIETQRNNIEKNLEVITHQKQEITDSIEYAKRIQSAALPRPEFLDVVFNEYFVLYKPKDIVSGDLYWASKKNNMQIAIAADCTGHGVPGAFMCMLGISLINDIVNDTEIIRPDLILNELRSRIIHQLQQKGIAFEAKDGMDIAACAIDYDNKKILFSGAYNPMYLVRNKEVIIAKADDQPIAIYDVMTPFVLHEFDLQKDDMVYLFSDGYADQFGGPKGKKLMVKRFREVLADISDKPMADQRKALDDCIEDWKNHKTADGNIYEQVDDILVMGIRL